MIAISTAAEPAQEKRIPVFSIDGVEYTMPAEVSASVSLNVLHLIRTRGEEHAVSWALEEVLGSEAYQALLGCKTLQSSDLKAVMEVVRTHVMGQMEGEAGN